MKNKYNSNNIKNNKINNNNKNSKEKSSKNDNNDNNNNYPNNIRNLYNNLNINNLVPQYINYIFYSKILHRENRYNNEVIKIDVNPDGNFLMRCLSLFIYNDENKYKNVRKEIVYYLKLY